MGVEKDYFPWYTDKTDEMFYFLGKPKLQTFFDKFCDAFKFVGFEVKHSGLVIKK